MYATKSILLSLKYLTDLGFPEEIRKNIFNKIKTPTNIEYYPTGNKKREEWKINGKLHRIEGPAVIEWRSNGNLKIEEWYINGMLHRVDKPAVVAWYDNGYKSFECWYNNDIPRTYGPMAICWHYNGYAPYECLYNNEPTTLNINKIYGIVKMLDKLYAESISHNARKW